MNPLRCPLSAPDPDLIHQFLTSLSLDELIFFSEQAYNQLSPAEKITYDINRFCSEYSDYEGRTGFIRTLLNNAVISAIHIPLSYQSNPRIIELIRPQTYEYYIPVAHELHDATSALTDELEQTPASAITVTNPRWVHVDETRKGESPVIAAIGDTVELLVDVSGYPEGAPVTFDIFDTGSDPAMRIETERGKNEGGIAKIQWVVSDPNERGAELKLCFEASARSKSSGQAPIDLRPASGMYRVEVVDDEEKAIEGVKVEFTVAGNATIVPTDAQGIAEHPAEDPAVDADVRILWEEGAAGSCGGGTATTASATDGTEDATLVCASGGEEDATTITAPVIPDTGETVEESAQGYEVFLVDDQEKPIEGVKVCFKTEGTQTTVSTDSTGRAFLPAQGSFSSAADVTLIWEDG